MESQDRSGGENGFPVIGILISPVLVIIFLVQVIRKRKNRRYLKNSVLCAAGCFLIVLAGMLMKRWAVPPASAFIMECKMNHYERAAKIQKSAWLMAFASIV